MGVLLRLLQEKKYFQIEVFVQDSDTLFLFRFEFCKKTHRCLSQYLCLQSKYVYKAKFKAKLACFLYLTIL